MIPAAAGGCNVQVWYISVLLSQGRMLCRTLGLPEEEQQGQEEEGLLPPQQGMFDQKSSI